MVYTSPTKVARIVTWDKQGKPRQDIANDIGIHHTTVTHILARFEKSADFYHMNPKTGRPHKFEE
jgi:transposase